MTRDPRFDRTVAEATGYTPRSLLATPLSDDRGTVGVLEVLDRRDGTFTLRDLDVASNLAREATIVVRRGRLERDATRLLRGALVALGGARPDAPLSEADVDALVSAATADLTDGGDEPIWRLADRLAQLIDGDPDRVGLAADWLDVLLRREGR